MPITGRWAPVTRGGPPQPQPRRGAWDWLLIWRLWFGVSLSLHQSPQFDSNIKWLWQQNGPIHEGTVPVTASRQACSIPALEWEDVPKFESRIKSMSQGIPEDRTQNINALNHTLGEGKIKGVCAFFDSGADANLADVKVLERLKIPWTRWEALTAEFKQRGRLAQVDKSTTLETLGIATIEWYFPQIDIIFSMPVMVVAHGMTDQEILIGDCFLRPLHNAMREAEVRHSSGPMGLGRVGHIRQIRPPLHWLSGSTYPSLSLD